MTMLSQIEAHLRRFREQIDMAKTSAKTSVQQGAKNIGVLVAPDLYARLKSLADSRGVSLKAAVLIAAEEGLQRLGF